MPGVIEVAFSSLYQYRNLILGLIALFVVCIVAYFMYTLYIKPFLLTKTKGYDDIPNRTKNNTETLVEIYFFHANWCPHCRKVVPEWESFSKQYNGKVVNGYTIECIDVDSTTETPFTTELNQKYNISGIPAIKIQRGDEVIDFNGKVNSDNLTAFVNAL